MQDRNKVQAVTQSQHFPTLNQLHSVKSIPIAIVAISSSAPPLNLVAAAFFGSSLTVPIWGSDVLCNLAYSASQS